MATVGDSASAVCAQCGHEFEYTVTRGGRPTRCPPCKAEYRKELTRKGVAAYSARKRERIGRQCRNCGETHHLKRSQFCGVECKRVRSELLARERDAISRTRSGARTADEAKAERAANVIRRECPECKAMYRPTRSGNHQKGPQRFCSRECLHAESRRRDAAKREAAILRNWARRYKAERAAKLKCCRDCGGATEKWKQYCAACQAKRREQRVCEYRQSEAYRAHKRVAKSRRRARVRGLDAERFDPFDIFERDHWRCHLCGVMTLKSKRGTMHDRAPELDHIVPLSRGGPHTRANVACSCRKCNHAKGAKPLGQLLLLAA